MTKLKFYSVLTALILMAMTATGIYAQSLSDFTYCTDIHVANATGSTWTDKPVRANINTLNMITAGFLNSTATDMALLDQAQTTVIPMTAEDVLVNNSSWWIHVASLLDDQTVVYSL